MKERVYIHFDEIWSLDFLNISDYEISQNKGYRYLPILIDNFSKFGFCVPLKKTQSRIKR